MTRVLRTSPGYTLIELVVVMLLLGIIAIACESGLHFGAQIWSRAHSASRSDDQVIFSQTILRQLIASALPRSKGAYLTFEGEPSSIRFDAIPPMAFQDGGTAHVQLSIERTRSESKLMVKLTSINTPAVSKQAYLFGNSGQLRFAYLDASGGMQTWLSYWRDRSRLPDAVRITSTDALHWPPLIIRPTISPEAACLSGSENPTCKTL